MEEKDKEIERLKELVEEEARRVDMYVEQRNKISEQLADCKNWKGDWQLEAAEHHKTKKRYDDLMAQAVRFAAYIKNSPVSHVIVKDAQAFLNSDEVQAFQAQQKEGG